MEKEYKIILINSLISIIAIFLASILTYIFTKNSEIESRNYYENKEALEIILKNTLKYSDYSLVEWNVLDTLYIRPYFCDWFLYEYFNKINVDSLIEKNSFPGEACRMYTDLQNARTDFIKITTGASVMLIWK